MELTNGIMLIDKPKGITSFDVIRRLRTELGVRKMGHSGTLDPLATGLLIVGVGEGTKRLAELIGLPKSYDARIELGKRSDTGDADGNVVEERAVPELTDADVRAALSSMVGELDLAVPAYSAVKRGGKPLYELARAGKEVEPPVKLMKVSGAELLNRDDRLLSVRFHVASGTYIRSLAEELGRRLGTVALVRELRRLSIGPYSVEDARPLAV